MVRRLTLLAGLVAGLACALPLNYTDPQGPRYIGGWGGLAPAPRVAQTAGSLPIRVVTFNVKFAEHVDRAIDLLGSTTPLEDADIIALQEMDEPGTRRIAAALGMAYVYYPATVHPGTGRDFGNAILSRWPITDDRKLILPRLARFGRTQRAAVAGTVLVGGAPVRVYSVHLGTGVTTGPKNKRDQVQTVLSDAASYEHVIIAGDMNSHKVGELFRTRGYAWPTEHQPHTDHFFNWDHIFLQGLQLRDSGSTGVVHDNHGASDHRPVWAVLVLEPPAPQSPVPIFAP